MAAITESANISINAPNGFLDPDNMGIDDRMKLLCALQAEI